MKSFKTVQELWAHCLFCPICKDMNRKPHISVGPYGVFKCNYYKKDHQFLILNCYVAIKNKTYLADYRINGLDNTFTYDLSRLPKDKKLSVEKSSKPFLYFFFTGICQKCHSNASSGDLEFDLFRKKIMGIKLEAEGLFFTDQGLEYHVSLDHFNQEMTICRYPVGASDIRNARIFRHPLIDLNLSDPKKILQKIKTILVFS